MNYKLILFDADDTLFDFEKSEKESFAKTFKDFNLQYDEKIHLKLYKKINGEFWKKLERNEISVEELKKSRFKVFFEHLNIEIDYSLFSNEYMKNLSNSSILLENAFELLESLKWKYNMAIVTNGFTNIQNNRVKKSKISHFFKEVFISEEIGYSKPEPEIFEYSINKLGKFEKNEVLMVGDNLVTDIMGAHQFGIDTCWVNLTNKINDKKISPKYEVKSLLELKEILK